SCKLCSTGNARLGQSTSQETDPSGTNVAPDRDQALQPIEFKITLCRFLYLRVLVLCQACFDE
ncbi:MAG TPA: hypothetical protein VMX74_05125, partial [Pirellulales bacterium]|nr:hypothetical protein [Pirellulales bacterium]